MSHFNNTWVTADFKITALTLDDLVPVKLDLTGETTDMEVSQRSCGKAFCTLREKNALDFQNPMKCLQCITSLDHPV